MLVPRCRRQASLAQQRPPLLAWHFQERTERAPSISCLSSRTRERRVRLALKRRSPKYAPLLRESLRSTPKSVNQECVELLGFIRSVRPRMLSGAHELGVRRLRRVGRSQLPRAPASASFIRRRFHSSSATSSLASFMSLTMRSLIISSPSWPSLRLRWSHFGAPSRAASAAPKRLR